MTLESFENIARAFSFLVSEKKSYLKCHSYHVMYAVFTKTDEPAKGPVRLTSVEESVTRYINGCQKKLEPVIKKIREANEPVILWGGWNFYCAAA